MESLDGQTRRIVKRVVLVTIVSIVASVAITRLMIYLMTGSVDYGAVSVLVSVLAPAVIAPIGSYFYIASSYRLREANERLRVLSETDPLTGIYNRRWFVQTADRTLALAKRHFYPTSILLLDLDNFKGVNDGYGHVMGDRVLVEITGVIKEQLRATDIFARFGGEEFVVLLPHTSREGAWTVAENIRKAVQSHETRDKGKCIRVSLSIGGFTCQISETSLDAMLSRADALLYECKNAGRNRCLVDVHSISNVDQPPVAAS